MTNLKPTVVLVHGGFVDGAVWEEIYGILRKDGYDLSIVQNPTLSLAGDVAEPTGPWCWWGILTAVLSSPRPATTRKFRSSI